MPISIDISITPDHLGRFRPIEAAILRALALDGTAGEVRVSEESLAAAADTPTSADDPTGENENPAPAPKRKRRTKAQIEADEAAKAEEAAGEEDAPKAPAESEDTDPSAEEPSTDEGGTDEDEDFLGVETPKVPTIEEVVERVSALMKKGKQEACKALLAEVTDGSVTRVSQMDAKFIPAFVAGLEKLEGK